MGTVDHAWRRAQEPVLTEREVNSMLARRPYDLATPACRPDSTPGVPPARVAEWAGHGVDVLLRVYANCVESDASTEPMPANANEGLVRPPRGALVTIFTGRVLRTSASMPGLRPAESPYRVRLAARFRCRCRTRGSSFSSHLDGLADVGRGEGVVRCCREGLPPRCAVQRCARGRLAPWALPASTNSATAVRTIQSAYSVLVQRCSRTSVR